MKESAQLVKRGSDYVAGQQEFSWKQGKLSELPGQNAKVDLLNTNKVLSTRFCLMELALLEML